MTRSVAGDGSMLSPARKAAQEAEALGGTRQRRW
eukprot:CAMPEP_0119176060 /NCGR_PEP_ID=MMETSP1315-20130426/44253_1 /TAXON_ID=676789 /ORGANISM="Prasinoderma singularis, Strain RCC927" /LENGTH=33 /DNA_ID= /DNA_START= /DNA_END= /DNA_ORIENTATION=